MVHELKEWGIECMMAAEGVEMMDFWDNGGESSASRDPP